MVLRPPRLSKSPQRMVQYIWYIPGVTHGKTGIFMGTLPEGLGIQLKNRSGYPRSLRQSLTGAFTTTKFNFVFGSDMCLLGIIRPNEY